MTQSLGWASGKNKPLPGVKATPRKRRRPKPPTAMTIMWAVVSLALSITFLIMQGTLLMVFMLLSWAVTALSAVADQAADRPAVPPPARPAASAANPRGNARGGRSPGTAGTAVPRCTNTGKPIDQCGCARRHVASADGARRYKRAIGAPMGRAGTSKPSKPKAVKKPKEPRVPTTNNAKPIRAVPGEVMRKTG